MMEERLYAKFLKALDGEDWERCERLARYINLVSVRRTASTGKGETSWNT